MDFLVALGHLSENYNCESDLCALVNTCWIGESVDFETIHKLLIQLSTLMNRRYTKILRYHSHSSLLKKIRTMADIITSAQNTFAAYRTTAKLYPNIVNELKVYWWSTVTTCEELLHIIDTLSLLMVSVD